MVFCGQLIYKDIFEAEYAQHFCYYFRHPDNLPDEVTICPIYNDEIATDYVAEARKVREQRPPIYVPDVPHHAL